MKRMGIWGLQATRVLVALSVISALAACNPRAARRKATSSASGQSLATGGTAMSLPMTELSPQGGPGTRVPLPTPSGGFGAFNYALYSGPGELDGTTYVMSASAAQAIVRITDQRGDRVDLRIKPIPYITNGTVKTSLVHGNDLFLGGTFDRVHGMRMGSFGALSATTGAPDAFVCNWQQKISGEVHTMLPSGDFVFIGGLGLKYAGSNAVGLLKIRISNCELDTGFQSASGEDGLGGTVYAIAQSGDAIFVGGNFSIYRGTSVSNLVKINALTGARVSAFNPPTLTSYIAGSVVFALAVGDGGLFVGGAFDQPSRRLFKVDLATGAQIAAFSCGEISGGSSLQDVHALLLTSGALYVAGGFSTFQGQVVRKIAKVSPTTCALDPVFSQTALGTDNGYVASMAMTPSGLVIGGSFVVPNGPARLALLDPVTGQVDSNLLLDFSAAGTPRVDAVVAVADGVLVGGNFTKVGGARAERLIKVRLPSGTKEDLVPETGFDKDVKAFARVGDRVYVGGDNFKSYGGTHAGSLAKINIATGEADLGFIAGGGVTDDGNTNGGNTVNALTILDGYLYVGGDFLSYRGQNALRLAKINSVSGDLDTGFTQTDGFNGPVNALAAGAGQLFVGGAFTTYRAIATQGVPARRLVRITDLQDGSAAEFGGLTEVTPVRALLFMNGSLFVGIENPYGSQQNFQDLRRYDFPVATPPLPVPAPTLGGSVDVPYYPQALAAAYGYLYVAHYDSPSDRNVISKVALGALGASPGLSQWSHASVNNPTSPITSLAAYGSWLYVGGAFSDIGPTVSPPPLGPPRPAVGGLVRLSLGSGNPDLLFAGRASAVKSFQGMSFSNGQLLGSPSSDASYGGFISVDPASGYPFGIVP